VVEQVKQPDSFGRHCMITTNHFGISVKKKQTISFAGGTNLNITNAWLTANGWDGKSSVTLINTGQIISVAATTLSAVSPALIISATMPQGLVLWFVNNGGVYGAGGYGGQANNSAASVGGVGSIALSVTSSTPLVITNNSNIAGGGGGGAAPIYGAGGGKGADQTNGANGGTAGSVNMGAGNVIYGGAGLNAYGANNQGAPGTPYNAGGNYQVASGGGGGAWGSQGGYSGSYSSYPAIAVGGAGGAAVTGNANIIWGLTGNRYGAIS